MSPDIRAIIESTDFMIKATGMANIEQKIKASYYHYQYGSLNTDIIILYYWYN